MSQSESSVDSTVTVPMKYIDMSVGQQEEEEDEEEEEEEDGLKQATMVLHEEIELMIQRVSQAIDCNKEILAILLQLHQTMVVK